MNYSRPPIVEAVAELRFSRPIDRDKLDKAHRKFTQVYPQSSERQDITHTFDLRRGEGHFEAAFRGFEIQSADTLDLDFLELGSLAVIRRAPYVGWTAFRERMMRDWAFLYDRAGPVPIGRLGLRFVNRLDLRAGPDVVGRLKELVQIWPTVPDMGQDNVDGFLLQTTMRVSDQGHRCNLTVSTIESPLAGHLALALDIDVHKEAPFSLGKMELLVAEFDELRRLKNEIFEKSVTDRAREQFGVNE